MIKAEWTNNDALSTGQTTYSNAHNTLNALDCVSRQYAIEHYQHVCRRTTCKECPLHIQVTDTLTDCELELFLHNLPSAQPERKKGMWLPDNRPGGGFWVCSCCKFPSEAFAADVLYKFCPNCGADMREVTE